MVRVEAQPEVVEVTQVAAPTAAYTLAKLEAWARDLSNVRQSGERFAEFGLHRLILDEAAGTFLTIIDAARFHTAGARDWIDDAARIARANFTAVGRLKIRQVPVFMPAKNVTLLPPAIKRLDYAGITVLCDQSYSPAWVDAQQKKFFDASKRTLMTGPKPRPTQEGRPVRAPRPPAPKDEVTRWFNADE
ncbi:MAG TPA: hypothetical protein VGB55_15570 [Tepidisphaeraceae bacterium]|jgi:hypothetical protein